MEGMASFLEDSLLTPNENSARPVVAAAVLT